MSGHYAALRKLKCCTKDASFVEAVENNYGGGPTAGRIMSYTAKYGPVIRMSSKLGIPGVQTTEHTNEDAISIGISLLSEGAIYFAADAACSTPKEYAKIRDECVAQLGKIHKRITQRKNGNQTYSYSGKSKNGGKDDLGFGLFFFLISFPISVILTNWLINCIGLLRAIYWTAQYQNLAEYERTSQYSRTGHLATIRA